MSYDQRVKEAGEVLARSLARGLSVQDAIDVLPRFLELRLPETSRARSQFIADVKRTVKTSKARERSEPRVRINGRLFPKVLLNQVWDLAMECWGTSFPDGDPWDRLCPKVARLAGVEREEVIDVVDRAFKELEKTTWSAWLETAWDEVVRDMDEKRREEMFGTSSPENPWRS